MAPYGLALFQGRCGQNCYVEAAARPRARGGECRLWPCPFRWPAIEDCPPAFFSQECPQGRGSQRRDIPAVVGRGCRLLGWPPPAHHWGGLGADGNSPGLACRRKLPGGVGWKRWYVTCLIFPSALNKHLTTWQHMGGSSPPPGRRRPPAHLWPVFSVCNVQKPDASSAAAAASAADGLNFCACQV